jgi:predicted homoserine dehydrogenase-like protein
LGAMYEALLDRESGHELIRVALVGAGSMGLGIAWQLARSPGFRLVSITDIDLAAAIAAAQAYGGSYAVVEASDPLPPGDPVLITREPFFLFERPELRLDALIEATNTIGFAAQTCLDAIDHGLHVVLMNAEVDLILGPLLHQRAAARGVVVTSDAGDQHGVLMRMIDEIRVWAFRIVMAGNIKGFLDRHATADSLTEEAAARCLNPIQCCAYTDGTKLGVEMALVANATGLVPWVPGMEGPRAQYVHDVFRLFDFDKYGDQGAVDYILGAQPGGGVFVVGHCADPLQMRYLQYYKMGDGPYYLFYRPYHLCHLETPWAVARAVLDGQAVLRPTFGRVADVYACAKRDIAAGEPVPQGIGGDQFYGLVTRCDEADRQGLVPISLLEGEVGRQPVLRAPLRRDAALSYDDVSLPDTLLWRLFQEQASVLRQGGAATDSGQVRV